MRARKKLNQAASVETIMPKQSSIHAYLNWTKQRIDEMDATLASFEAQAAEAKSESKVKADQLKRIGSACRCRSVHPLRQIEQEFRRFVVIRIDGHPRPQASVLAKPFRPTRGERGLAKPRGRVDHRQPHC